MNIALISDAGTPAISDPGFLLVRECVREGIEVECLPGATAFVPALVSSGLPDERFCFEGFLPQKKGRQTRLEQLSAETRTMVFYESPYRVIKTLEQFALVFGEERHVCVSRNMNLKASSSLCSKVSMMLETRHVRKTPQRTSTSTRKSRMLTSLVQRKRNYKNQ